MDVHELEEAAVRSDESYEPSTPWWLSGTPLEAEHHRLMRRRSQPRILVRTC